MKSTCALRARRKGTTFPYLSKCKRKLSSPLNPPLGIAKCILVAFYSKLTARPDFYIEPLFTVSAI